MLNNDSLSSGFFGQDFTRDENMFTNVEEFHISPSSYSRLHICRRYGKLHILKSLQPPYDTQEFYKQLQQKEFNISYQLDHPHIRHTIDWEKHEELGPCIVLEYIDGISLKEFMDQGRLTPVLAYKFIAEICEALQYIHNKQLVHKDLKPGNVIITHNGNNVKIIDFGLSDCDDYDILKIPAGTEKYLAPEQLLPHAVLDCRIDIYSLGVIIEEMGLLLKDKKLRTIARKCTQREPGKRYRSALEVLEALRVKKHDRVFLYAATVVVACILSFAYMKDSFLPTSYPVRDSITRVYSNSTVTPTCQKVYLKEKSKVNRKLAIYKSDRLLMEKDSTEMSQALHQALREGYPDSLQRESAEYRQQLKQIRNRVDQTFRNARHAIE